jgi:hypothetical protein
METGIADPEKAVRALETGSKFVNPFGVFVTGIDRDESAGDEGGSFQTNKKIFTYIGAVMTLPTGVQAVAKNNYARPDHALNYLERMTNTFSYALPGSMYEVSPDYGMIVQAWNIYSFAVPIVSQFFGINPDSYEGQLEFNPQMPQAWDSASLQKVNMGSNSMDFEFERKEKTEIWKIRSAEIWNIQLKLPSDRYTRVLLDGEPISAVENNPDTFTFEVGTSEPIILELEVK